MTITDMVRQFASVTRQDPPDPQLYARLIHEEFGEWVQEPVGSEASLKELCDLVYVIFGHANAMGWNMEEAIRRVHENNVGRCIQPGGEVKFREDGKVMKNPAYPKVYLTDLIRKED